jgi:hypothetical protein
MVHIRSYETFGGLKLQNEYDKKDCQLGLLMFTLAQWYYYKKRTLLAPSSNCNWRNHYTPFDGVGSQELNSDEEDTSVGFFQSSFFLISMPQIISLMSCHG